MLFSFHSFRFSFHQSDQIFFFCDLSFFFSFFLFFFFSFFFFPSFLSFFRERTISPWKSCPKTLFYTFSNYSIFRVWSAQKVLMLGEDLLEVCKRKKEHFIIFYTSATAIDAIHRVKRIRIRRESGPLFCHHVSETTSPNSLFTVLSLDYLRGSFMAMQQITVH